MSESKLTKEDRDGTPCFIAKTPCGCIVCVAVDRPEYAKDNAKEVARWIRKGLTIEKMSVFEVQKSSLGCSHKKAKGESQ